MVLLNVALYKIKSLCTVPAKSDLKDSGHCCGTNLKQTAVTGRFLIHDFLELYSFEVI